MEPIILKCCLHLELKRNLRWLARPRDWRISGLLWSPEQVATQCQKICEVVATKINYKATKETRAAEVIQEAWRKCRWNPEYKMCEKVQLINLATETRLLL